jgi:glyoxylase I family protein
MSREGSCSRVFHVVCAAPLRSVGTASGLTGTRGEMPVDFAIHHTAISVIDMPESLAFYEQFGFTVVLHWKDPDGELEIAHLKLSDNYLEIFWYKDQSPAPETAGSLAADLPRIGVKHFALEVDSVDKAKEFVEQRGIASNVEVQQGRTGVSYFFIKDPSGILVEFLEDKRGI